MWAKGVRGGPDPPVVILIFFIFVKDVHTAILLMTNEILLIRVFKLSEWPFMTRSLAWSRIVVS